MREFAEGQRVAVYGFDFCGTYHNGDKGTVQPARPGKHTLVLVKFDGFISPSSVHPRQCTRLVKEERRRIWIDEPSLRDLGTTEGSQGEVFAAVKPMPRAIEFIEVRKAYP